MGQLLTIARSLVGLIPWWVFPGMSNRSVEPVISDYVNVLTRDGIVRIKKTSTQVEPKELVNFKYSERNTDTGVQKYIRPVVVNNYKASPGKQKTVTVTEPVATTSRKPDNIPETSKKHKSNEKKEVVIVTETRPNWPVATTSRKPDIGLPETSKKHQSNEKKEVSIVTETRPNRHITINDNNNNNRNNNTRVDKDVHGQETRVRQNNKPGNELLRKIAVETGTRSRQVARPVNADDFLAILTNAGVLSPSKNAQKRYEPSTSEFETMVTSYISGLSYERDNSSERASSLTADDFLDILESGGMIEPDENDEGSKKEWIEHCDPDNMVVNQDFIANHAYVTKQRKPVIEDSLIEKLLSHEELGSDEGLPKKDMDAIFAYNDDTKILINTEPYENNRNRPLNLLAKTSLEKVLTYKTEAQHNRQILPDDGITKILYKRRDPDEREFNTPILSDNIAQVMMNKGAVRQDQAEKRPVMPVDNNAKVPTCCTKRAPDISKTNMPVMKNNTPKVSTSKGTVKQDPNVTKRNRPTTPEQIDKNTNRKDFTKDTSNKERVSPSALTLSGPGPRTADDFLNRLTSAGLVGIDKKNSSNQVKASTSSNHTNVGAPKREVRASTSSNHTNVGAPKREKPDTFHSNLDTLVSEGTMPADSPVHSNDKNKKQDTPTEDLTTKVPDEGRSTGGRTTGGETSRVTRATTQKPFSGDDFVMNLVNEGLLDPNMDVQKRTRLVTAVEGVFEQMNGRLSSNVTAELLRLERGGPSSSKR